MSAQGVGSGDTREGRSSSMPASFRAAWVFGALAVILGMLALLQATAPNALPDGDLTPPPRLNGNGGKTDGSNQLGSATGKAQEVNENSGPEYPLPPRVREIYFKEVELREQLLAVLAADGPDAAFRTAVEWVESDQSNLEGQLRVLIALRGLPGLAKETGSNDRTEEALGILLKRLYDPAVSRNVFCETADALSGNNVCYVRDEDLSREHGFTKFGRCWGHSLYSGIPQCPENPLTMCSFSGPFGPDARVMAALEFVATDPSGQFGSLWAEKAVLQLADVDPKRSSRFLWQWYDELENQERMKPPIADGAVGDAPMRMAIRERATWRSRVILEYTRPQDAPFQAVLEIGMTSPSAEIRAGILEAINKSKDGWAEFDPDLTQYFSQTVHFAVEAGDQDPAVRDWLIAQTVERIRSMSEIKKRFEDERQYQRHLALMESARPIYRRAVESILALPGSDIPEDWKRHLRRVDDVPPDGWTVGKTKISIPADRLMGPYLRSILRDHPQSERARAMLALCEEVEPSRR